MTFPSGLKRVCDISFFMTFASIVGMLLGSDPLITTLPIFIFVAFLSAFLAPRGRIKYISILPLLIFFLIFPLTFANLVILIPASFFMIFSFPKSIEDAKSFEYSGIFKTFLVIFVWLLLISSIFGAWTRETSGLSTDTILFAISFIVTTILFMRMTRHDESVLKQTTFKIMNAIPLVLIVAGVGFISMDTLSPVRQGVANFIYRIVLVPIFTVLIWLLEGIARIWFMLYIAIMSFFERELTDGMEELGNMGNMGMPIEEIYDLYEAAEGVNGFAIILAVFVIIMLVLLIILLKYLTNKSATLLSKNDGAEEERVSLDLDIQKKKNKSQSRSREENQVREVYRRFLIFIKKKNIEVPLSSTSSDVEDLVATNFKSGKSTDLRDAYIQVRYGETAYTKDDVKRFKGLYQEVKEEIERS